MYGKPVMTFLKSQVNLYCVEANHIFECYTLSDHRARTMTHSTALIKKKTKFSSCIRIFRMEQLQSHMGLTATSYSRISSYIREPFLIYDFATAPL
jgi:hypothetical protein